MRFSARIISALAYVGITTADAMTINEGLERITVTLWNPQRHPDLEGTLPEVIAFALGREFGKRRCDLHQTRRSVYGTLPDGTTVSVAWDLADSQASMETIHHLNGDPTDNRLENLARRTQ